MSNERRNFLLFYGLAMFLTGLALLIFSLVCWNLILLILSILLLILSIIEMVIVLFYYRKHYTCDRQKCEAQERRLR